MIGKNDHTSQRAAYDFYLRKYDLAGSLVEVDNLKTFFVEKGQGQPLVLLHGLSSCLFTWRNNIGRLAEKFRVIALDLPGHGFSESLPNDTMPIKRYSEFIKHFLKVLDIDTAGFIGHSFGGTICLQLCNNKDAIVNKVVLVSAPVPQSLLLNEKTINNLFLFVYHQKSHFFTEMIQIIKSLPTKISSYSICQQVFFEYSNVATKPLVRSQIPCQIVWGKNDTLFPPSTSLIYKEWFEKSKTTMFEKCGHAPHEEKHTAFNNIILDFLQQ